MLTIQGLKIAWLWIKKYYGICFAVLASVLAYILFRKGSPTDMATQIDAINTRHQAEIDAIKKANDVDIAEHEANQARLEAALKLLDNRYRTAIANLDTQKQAEIVQIVKQSGNDPVALAELLAKTLGFQVV